MSAGKIYAGNDTDIIVTGLALAATGALQSNGALTATLLDGSGNPVTGAADIVLSAVDGTPGSYIGNISHEVTVSPGTYTLKVVGDVNGKHIEVIKAVTVSQLRKVQ